MIIRSQDKKQITNFKQITDISILANDGKFDIQIFYPFSVDNGYAQMRLAIYSTEEKAIKVLDMMCDHNFWCRDVFQMPTDEEVEV